MAVNKAQVDQIISTASADDPLVKLLKLQNEVELYLQYVIGDPASARCSKCQ